MNKRLAIVLVVLGLAVIGTFSIKSISWTGNFDTNDPVIQPNELVLSSHSMHKNAKNSESNRTVPPTQFKPRQERILQEISNRKFSNDPYTELLSLMAVMGHCLRNEQVGDLALYYGTAYPVHDEMNLALKKRCDDYHQQYPELIKTIKNEQGTQVFKPQSKLGQMIETFLDRNTTDEAKKELSKVALLEAIRKNNSIMLIRAGSFQELNIKSHVFPIAKLLQSNDYKYLYHMNQTAIKLMSCQFNQGISCDNSSDLMRLVCAKNPLACGHDFISWYEKSTLPGMKIDVEKLIDFYTRTALN